MKNQYSFKYSASPFYHSVLYGNWDIVKLLIFKSSMQLNKRRLGHAFYFGIFEHISFTLGFINERKIDLLEPIGPGGRNALQHACSNGWIKSVKALLELHKSKGIKVDNLSNAHKSLFYMACKSQNVELVMFILENYYHDKLSMRFKLESIEMTIFHIACKIGSYEVVKTTKNYFSRNPDFDIDGRDSIGMTPFGYACRRNDDDKIIELFLMDIKLDAVSAIDYRGMSSIHVASQWGHLKFLARVRRTLALRIV